MAKEFEETSHFQRLFFNENPNVGVFCRTNENVCFIMRHLTKKIKNKVNSALKVKIVETTIAEATIIGSLLSINSHGAVITDLSDEKVNGQIVDQGLNIFVIDDKINAAGNIILVNDYGALVHPDFKDTTIKKMKEIFEVPVERGTIGSLKTVGMAAVVTNKGLLCHPKIDTEEQMKLEKIFDVEVMIGTVNHGVPLIGSGLVANTKGAIIGGLTTGIEMGRIEEALHFLD
ncbi:MAG: translation initiation factor IF-6 [Candidatus Thermoplasmatota archaeon]|nr:translation initiation factor IF-6 [Candidatus Thermoplasmatota archaeon]